MPRPILRTPRKEEMETRNLLSASYQREEKRQMKQMDKLQMDRLLRKTRSKEYMETMHKLDAGGHVHNQEKVKEIINAIKQEFPEVEIEGILLGCVSVCYLGKPYEVHALDITGGILEHYKAGQMMPGGLEKARGIAMHGGYDFIEVYVDCCRAISSNGTVSVISC